jgi:sugar O-acyltransferase (sialic acid O-acetyltransferase NeuD family)
MARRKTAVVLGASGHAKVVIATLLASGWEVMAAYDDDPTRLGSVVMGVPVVGPIDLWSATAGEQGVIAIGSNRVRAAVAARLKGRRFATAVHPMAWVAPTARLGKGTVVFAGAIIQPDTVLGRHVIVNTGASIDHDCRVDDFVHIAPGVRLAGGVTVGEGALVGIGASVIPGVRIGAWATAGAGACVIRDVPACATVAGVPARSREK